MLDADFFRRWMTAATVLVDREADRLTALDSPIGDADHGSNLQRGFTAVAATLEKEAPDTPGAVLILAGRQLISTVGGASGPLYGTLLRRTGKALGDSPEVSADQLAEALRAGVDAVRTLGGAAPGDKTMVDALVPAVEALGDSFAAARTAAVEGAEATTPLQARKGRASYLGERSIGHQDPGRPRPRCSSWRWRRRPVSDGKLVGIVLVSHSAAVAASVAELAKALSGGARAVAVAPAGGTASGEFGTSSELVAAAAASVDRGAGVAVLTDLGSAVLTVKALLAEGDELPENTRLVDAPFVEGAVAAVVTASTGADLAAVEAAAAEAYSYRKV